ncbi:hypothetical protein [Flavonifractor hominis]|uniref:CdaR GGDEF-like domain-containing protein n=1 Tax=Flavonifractor hominis TaxID=3133178 RepID=A0ABV1EP96_9FIRM
MDLKSQSEAWKDLVGCLPGILESEFVVENDTIREVHILSDQSRGPKQIVRDVQSAMLARFHLELDHRIISVAQIPGRFSAEHHRRLICERLELSGGRSGSSVVVHLSLDGNTYSGRACYDSARSDRMRAIAQATVEAINLLLASGCRFFLEDVRYASMGERRAILVGLHLKYDGKTEALLGACYEGDDPNFSVALATLDGVNRRFTTLPFAKEGEPVS